MKRRIFTLLSAGLALCAFASGAAACREEPPYVNDENYIYSETDGGYEITGLNDVTLTELTIPASYNGKPVLKIGESAFFENETITGAVIPDSVTVIGELAFANCYALEAVTLGKSLKTIDEYAFSQCSSLKGIDFPSSLETIGECAFVSCVSLDKADFKDGLKSIGDCAFGGCTSVKSFTIPDSVTKIGWGVIMFQQGDAGFETPDDLANCLTEVVISDSITEIPDYAFSKSNIKTAVIGKSVETVRYSSFYGCGLLESVVIPKSVNKIESYAFYQCSALASVFYEGSAAEWSKITVGKNGNDISSATKYFYSETSPGRIGNFWHYVNGVPAIWSE